MLEVIGIKNCNTIKKTLNWLNENDFEYSFRDVKKEPLSPNELAEFVRKVGLDTLINRKGMKWRTLGLKDKNLSDNDLFDVLHEHQTMIKRPLLHLNEAAMVGFDDEALTEFIMNNK